MSDSEEDASNMAKKSSSSENNNINYIGPIYTAWEATLEKFKLLDYESNYCIPRKKLPFNRIHFVFPAANPSVQFDDFIDVCQWLFTQIKSNSETFKRDEFDDPNTVANKLLLSLRQLDFRSSFPASKLRTAFGEHICLILEFLVDKVLSSRGFAWKSPVYQSQEEADAVELDDENEDVEDDIAGGIDEDMFLQENQSLELDAPMDTSAHQILVSHIDPIAWKTELERVGPKLRSQNNAMSHEWRAHVDQTLNNKTQIGSILGTTIGDLIVTNKEISEDISKLKTREKYINNQFLSSSQEFKEVKQKLQEYESKSSRANEVTSKLNQELSELAERTDELKDNLESKDSGIHDTSPLVRIKAALQQIKSEIYSFDLRGGVISNSLLHSRIKNISHRKHGHKHGLKKNWKSHRDDSKYDDNSPLFDEY